MRLAWSDLMMSVSCIDSVQESALKSVFAAKTQWFLLTPKTTSSREGNEGRHGDGREKGGTSLKKKGGA